MICVLKVKKILALNCLIWLSDLCSNFFIVILSTYLLISQASLFTNKKSANLYIEQFFIEDDQYLQFLIFTPLGLRTILAHLVEIHSELAFFSKLKGLKNVKKSIKFIWRYLKLKQSWEIFSNLVAFQIWKIFPTLEDHC